MNVSDIRALDSEQLQEKIDEQYQELFLLRQKKVTSHLEDVKSISRVKKTIARLLTVQRQQALGQEN